MEEGIYFIDLFLDAGCALRVIKELREEGLGVCKEYDSIGNTLEGAGFEEGA